MFDRFLLRRVGISCAIALGATGAAQAALIDRGGGLIYDDVLNVTWLQDANYAQTGGYENYGYMTWADAVAWAANLTYYDSVRGVTYDDWRLPITTDLGDPGCDFGVDGTDCGWNVNPDSSEMAHLFHVSLGNISAWKTDGNYLGGRAGEDYGLVNTGPFINFQDHGYWSGTEYAPNPSYAWSFFTGGGGQFYGGEGTYYTALAVRPGDVAVVPEPGTVALVLGGLGLLGWRAQRRA